MRRISVFRMEMRQRRFLGLTIKKITFSYLFLHTWRKSFLTKLGTFPTTLKGSAKDIIWIQDVQYIRSSELTCQTFPTAITPLFCYLATKWNFFVYFTLCRLSLNNCCVKNSFFYWLIDENKILKLYNMFLLYFLNFA